MARIDTLLRLIPTDQDDALLLLRAGQPPLLRRSGTATALSESGLAPEELHEVLAEVAPAGRREALNMGGLLYQMEAGGSFLLRQIGDGLYIRPLPARPVSPTLPPALLRLVHEPEPGLILCSGPAGSGRSTTLAALLSALNEDHQHLILTFEEPLLYLHRSQRAVLVQREIGVDVASAAAGLRGVPLLGADVVLVDPLPIEPAAIGAALHLAETGHLVLGALSAASCADALEQVGAAARAGGAGTARLCRSLRGLISQRLCPCRDGGRLLCCELLLGGPDLAATLEHGRTGLMAYLAAGRHLGMHSLDDCLADLVEQGALDPAQAYVLAQDKRRFPSPFVNE
jgi:twitching motility protein PilT